MWLIRSAVILVGVIAILWVGMSNADQSVDFTFFTKKFVDLSLNLLLLVVFFAGLIIAFFVMALSEFQLRHTIGQKEREVARLERELSALRNLPLEEGEDESEETQVTSRGRETIR